MCLGTGVYRSLFYSHFEQRSEQVDGRARSNLINLPQAGVALCVGDRLVVCPGCTLPLTLHSWGRQPPKKLGCVFYVNRVICNRVKSEVLSRFWNDMLMHQLFYHSSCLYTTFTSVIVKVENFLKHKYFLYSCGQMFWRWYKCSFSWYLYCFLFFVFTFLG